MGWFTKEKFNGAACKANLKMAISRSKIYQNKLTQQVKLMQREAGVMLSEGKEQRAKIKAEQIVQSMNTSDALDLVETMCDLLATRMGYLEPLKLPPPDLIVQIQTIVYTANRAPVEELGKVAKAFEVKYGEEWVKMAAFDEGGLVHPDVVRLLSTSPPGVEKINDILKECCVLFKVEWTPAEERLGDAAPAEGNNADEAAYLANLKKEVESDPTIGGLPMTVPGSASGGNGGMPPQPQTIAVQEQELNKFNAEVNPGPQTIVMSEDNSRQTAPSPNVHPAMAAENGANGRVNVRRGSRPVVSAKVPVGLEPGMQMVVYTPDGQKLTITIPDGTFPGSYVHVEYTPLIGGDVLGGNAAQTSAMPQPSGPAPSIQPAPPMPHFEPAHVLANDDASPIKTAPTVTSAPNTELIQAYKDLDAAKLRSEPSSVNSAAPIGDPVRISGNPLSLNEPADVDDFTKLPTTNNMPPPVRNDSGNGSADTPLSANTIPAHKIYAEEKDLLKDGEQDRKRLESNEDILLDQMLKPFPETSAPPPAASRDPVAPPPLPKADSTEGGDEDFDNLMKRFEALKNK